MSSLSFLQPSSVKMSSLVMVVLVTSLGTGVTPQLAIDLTGEVSRCYLQLCYSSLLQLSVGVPDQS